jgi:DNA repair protein RadC
MKYQTSTSAIGLNLLETSNGMYQLTAPVTLEELLSIASSLLEDQFKRSDYLSSPMTTRSYLRTKLSTREREVFACIFLDSQHVCWPMKNSSLVLWMPLLSMCGRWLSGRWHSMPPP